jgi:hypothetical protein
MGPVSADQFQRLFMEAYWENGGSKQGVMASLGHKHLLARHLERLFDRTAKAPRNANFFHLQQKILQ